MPDIAQKLKIQSGKNAGKHPSIATLYRAWPKPTRNTSPPARKQPPPTCSRSAHGGVLGLPWLHPEGVRDGQQPSGGVLVEENQVQSDR